MNYRTATILSKSDLGGAGTKIMDINLRDIISRIELHWQVSKSKHSMDAPAYKDITKIELVDGSDVLFSMDGGEAQALNLYDRRVASMINGDFLSGDWSQSMYAIDFGRYLYDRELAFDPTKFRNPQLKVTWDEDVSDTGVTDNYLEVLAYVFDERKPTPAGFLMSKEHWAGAMTSAGYEYIELPTDHPIRKMLLKSYADGREAFNLLSNVKIDEDNEKRIPFDYANMEDYTTKMHGYWIPITEAIIARALQEGAIFYSTPTCYCRALGAVALVDSFIHTTEYGTGGKITFNSSVGAAIFQGVVMGYLPNHCIEFPFGKQDDPADWYDVTKLGSCRLRFNKGGVTASAGAVVLQQLRKY